MRLSKQLRFAVFMAAMFLVGMAAVGLMDTVGASTGETAVQVLDPTGDCQCGGGDPMPTPTATPPASSTPTPTPTPPVNEAQVWGYDTQPESPTFVRPGLLAPYPDPAYNSIVQRFTAAEDGTRHRNDYSRRQTENADGSYVLTHFNGPGGEQWRVYERVGGALVNELPVYPDGEPQWHPTEPALMRHLAGDNASRGELRLYEINVETLTVTVVADLTDRLRSAWPGAQYMKDREEGSPSMDGTRHAWLVYDNTEDLLGIVSYDLATDEVLGTVDVVPGVGLLDAVSASPTGTYVLAQYGSATYVYDADLTNRRLINEKGDHSDIALDVDGVDTYVHVDFSTGPNAGWVVAVSLETLVTTRLFYLYGGNLTSIHISGKGYDKPGWVVASTYNCRDVDTAWACNKVFAAEMVEGGRILNLAHTYNCDDNDYYNEAHGVVTRDFSRVYFNSDSGQCDGPVEVYQVAVPDF